MYCTSNNIDYVISNNDKHFSNVLTFKIRIKTKNWLTFIISLEVIFNLLLELNLEKNSENKKVKDHDK